MVIILIFLVDINNFFLSVDLLLDIWVCFSFILVRVLIFEGVGIFKVVY